ncbi:LysE family translocator [Vibrio pacinii]|uniref:LysE family translocator n=1 Tax=Vibrio pacinii TaxID=170674 RepID=UPI00056DC7DD|nr:LysE family translocator [Vibrio pacinii]EHA1126867.1 LysE family translocator [Vibrio navarrensis]ELI5733390.1 LysE family translocator [Vibrio fluvialis]
MDFNLWLGFVAASLILTATPGPSIFLGIAHALKYGHKRVLYTALGDISANFIQMVLVALGLGVILANSVMAFTVIKVFGVITLVYMGLKMLLAKPAQVEHLNLKGSDLQASNKKLFYSGFLVAAGNPKAILFFSAFFPQFINPDLPVFPQLLVMCPTMALLDFSLVMFYAFSARRIVDASRLSLTAVTRGSGALLLGSAGILALKEPD